jgi:pimeloyl-ACP methyl ester carboxylesterase
MPRDYLHQTAPTRFTESTRARFAYRTFGVQVKTPLIFLQHYTGTTDNWDPVLTNYLAQKRSVILFDNAGIGRSTGTTPDTIGAMARDAVSFIRSLDLPLVDLFEFSIGGMVAQEIAVQSPEVVRRLILAGSAAQGGENISDISDQAKEILFRPNATFEERILDLFFFTQSNKPGRRKGLASSHRGT